MVSESLRTPVETFIRRVTSVYEPQEDLGPEAIEHIREHYFQTLARVPEGKKQEVLRQLEQSWDQNPDHTARGDWGGAAVGIARFLLLPNTMDELEVDACNTADALVRLTRWCYTVGNLRSRFRAYAHTIILILFGREIADLAGMYGRKR